MEDQFFWFRLEGSDFDLHVSAPDKPLSEEYVMLATRLLVAGWNDRHAARHCPGHQWQEEFAMDEEAFGPGVINAICSLCHVTRLAWRTQQLEESAAMREP